MSLFRWIISLCRSLKQILSILITTYQQNQHNQDSFNYVYQYNLNLPLIENCVTLSSIVGLLYVASYAIFLFHIHIHICCNQAMALHMVLEQSLTRDYWEWKAKAKKDLGVTRKLVAVLCKLEHWYANLSTVLLPEFGENSAVYVQYAAKYNII